MSEAFICFARKFPDRYLETFTTSPSQSDKGINQNIPGALFFSPVLNIFM
jgi:hypothetical protein